MYLAKPPLFKIEKNKKIHYAYTEQEAELISLPKSAWTAVTFSVTKVWERWMRTSCGRQPWIPESRILMRVVMDEDSTSELDLTFTTLNG